MKVPYAKKWQKETEELRQIALACDLLSLLRKVCPMIRVGVGSMSFRADARLRFRELGRMYGQF
jgi:hypothetical protein